MTVRVLFLGKLADQAKEAERVIEVAEPLDWNGLLNHFEPVLGAMLRGDKICVALNGMLIPDKLKLWAGNGDEVAFLPPVSGG